jgi:[acyl-carrier-protein] S-malonyltransferase
MTRALTFPGQGSQAIGMGRELSEAFAPAREVFEEVDEALKQKLFKLMAEGPAEALQLTENAQPALMAVSLAVIRVLEREMGFIWGTHASFVAGHSLGEYSALCAAGALTVPQTAKLLRRRGQAMQRAVPVGQGAMAALLGADLEQAKALAADAAKGEVCAVANDNGAGQVVISGAKGAIDRAIALAPERGIKRAVLVPVSAPFHSPLMAPAAKEMEEALADTDIKAPRVPVIANVTAAPVDDPELIRTLLVQQVTGVVRWRETVESFKSLGITKAVEVGAGKVLTGLAKRIDRDIEAQAIGLPAEIEAFAKTL